MDAVTLILSIGSAAVAGTVAVIVGRRRGIDQVDARVDAEMSRLIDAQSRRLLLADAERTEWLTERASMLGRIDALEATVKRLEEELEMERRITRRFTGDA